MIDALLLPRLHRRLKGACTMMTLEQIRERNRKENAAAQPPSGRRVSAGRMGPPHRAADRRPDHRREHQRRTPHVLQLSPPGRMPRPRFWAECPPDALAEPHRTKRPRPTTPAAAGRSSRTSTTTNKGAHTMTALDKKINHGHLSRAAPQSDPAPLPRQPPGDHPEHQPQRTKENEP